MGVSKKHHYIPRFYLEGFTDETGVFFMHDKQTGRTWRTQPANAFAENHRNRGRISNHETGAVFESDMPEQMLSYFDSKASVTLRRIIDSNPAEPVLTDENLIYLRMLMQSAFWRSPVNDALLNSTIQNHSFESLGMGIFHSTTGERNVQIEEDLKSIDMFKKTYQGFLPLVSFRDFSKINDSKWKLYYKQKGYAIITDLPVLLKNFSGPDSLHNDIIFPVSNHIYLVGTKGSLPTVMHPIFHVYCDLLLFCNAGRYIACANRKYLDFLIDQNKAILLNNGWTEKLKQLLFGMFDNN